MMTLNNYIFGSVTSFFQELDSLSLYNVEGYLQSHAGKLAVNPEPKNLRFFSSYTDTHVYKWMLKPYLHI